MTAKKRTYRAGMRVGIAGRPLQDVERGILLAIIEGIREPVYGDSVPPETWHLWLRPLASTTKGWWSLKLVAERRVRLKANYWISWHAGTGRMGPKFDNHKLRIGRPDLYEAVESTLLGANIGCFEMDVRVAPRGAIPVNLPLRVNKGIHGSPPEDPATTLLEEKPLGVESTLCDENEDLL
jgi:hypothetical protein